MEIPASHPRYRSLTTREDLVKKVNDGMVSQAGLIAHGRGEAFDYLLGEKTIEPAKEAEMVAAAYLLRAKNPVLSINGNVAALVGKEMVELSKEVPAKIEINLFHRTPLRMELVYEHLKECGADTILGLEPDNNVPGLDHARSKCTNEGIYTADVVLVPLEDGDRAQALVGMGKTVITIDINPLSRTSKTSTVSIVDEVTRAIPNITEHVKGLKGDEQRIDELVNEFNNEKNLKGSCDHISQRLAEEFSNPE